MQRLTIRVGGTAVFLLVTSGFLGTDALASDCGVGAGAAPGGVVSSVIIQGRCEIDSASGGPVGSFSEQVSEGTEPRPVMAQEPMWGTHPETSEVCLDLVMSSHVTVNSQIALLWEARMLTMIHDPRLDDVEHRWCDASSNVLIADPSPLVRDFVRSIPLPALSITVAPGYGLTGMPAYLVIGGQESFTVNGTIPGFGQLEAELRPVAFVVDWGDGTVDLVDDGRTGVPWDGPEEQQIEHTYIHTDEDNRVAVAARWDATWRVGAFSGTVTDLQVSSALDLPVRAKRSVRIAPEE